MELQLLFCQHEIRKDYEKREEKDQKSGASREYHVSVGKIKERSAEVEEHIDESVKRGCGIKNAIYKRLE